MGLAIAKNRRIACAIPLKDPRTSRKIRLRLRRMEFAKEIESLPTNLKDLHKVLLGGRRDRNDSVYRMVSAWNRMRPCTDYWEEFGFQSEAEYLAYFGLPDGTTLAHWTVVVTLFDRATFVLL